MTDAQMWITSMWMIWFLFALFWIPIRFLIGLFTDKRIFRGVRHALVLAVVCFVITLFAGPSL